MVEAFCGTWKLVNSENFDEYMKALGKFYDNNNEYSLLFLIIFICIYYGGNTIRSFFFIVSSC